MNPSPWLVVSLCAAVTMALVLWLHGRPDPAPFRPAPVAVTAASPAVVPARSPSWMADEPRVEYAPRMPMGPGVAVVDGNGQFIGDAVRVAVPDGHGQLQFLPNNDPRAIRYDEEQRAEHSRVIQDEGPRDVDIRAITVKNSVTARQRSVPVIPKP